MKHFLPILSLLLSFQSIQAATLPTHTPLRILIVSDEVNPHGLNNAELTQPGDIYNALTNPQSGLNIDTVVEIPTNDIHLATALLSLPNNDPNRYDVLIYFAHRIPNDGTAQQNQNDQDNFTTAVESFLQNGGGVVCFHHGIYSSTGKSGILDIMGATATGNVPWNTSSGQNVISVVPSTQSHYEFITTNGVNYTGTIAYWDASLNIPTDNYNFFNNTPDERYPYLTINQTAGTIIPLFASNYNDNGTTHILGFVHQHQSWTGEVIFYQPGEYQPNALDDLSGNNFQILANAIYIASDNSVPTSIEEAAITENTYPNPFNESFILPARVVSFQVFDLSGKLIEEASNSNNSIGHYWKPGYYTLRTFNKSGVIQHQRIIKQ